MTADPTAQTPQPEQPARSTETGLEATQSPEAGSCTSGPEIGAQHVIRWTYDGCAEAEAVCLAAPDADCRLEAVDHSECQCEHWGRIDRRDDGTIWHALTDGHRDLTLPRDQEQWHQVRASEGPAESTCNVCLFINESGCVEELTPDGEHHDFVIADVPFEPVWENDGCSWRPKPIDLESIVADRVDAAGDRVRADALAICAALLRKVVDYWDGRPLSTGHGVHLYADLVDVLRAIEADRDHNRQEQARD